MTVAIAQPSLGVGANGWIIAAYAGSGGASQATSISYPTTTAGNAMLVVNVGVGASGSASAPAYTVTGASALLTPATETSNNGSNNWAMFAVHLFQNIAGGTLVIPSSSNAGAFNCHGITAAVELSGIPTSGAADASCVNVAAANSTTPAIGSVTPSQSFEFLVAGYSMEDIISGTQTGTSGFTNAVHGSQGSDGIYSVDFKILNNVAPTGYVTNWGAVAAAHAWAAGIAGIKGVISAAQAIAGGQLFVLP